MTTMNPSTQSPEMQSPKREKRRAKPKVGASLLARGEPMVWLTGGGLAISVVMIIGLLFIVFYNGLTAFWPKPLEAVTLLDDSKVLGRVTREEMASPPPAFFEDLNDDALIVATAELIESGKPPAIEALKELADPEHESVAPKAAATLVGLMETAGLDTLAGLGMDELSSQSREFLVATAHVMLNYEGTLHRRLYNDANFDIDREHFTWVYDFQVVGEPEMPETAILIDRFGEREFIGFLKEMREYELDDEGRPIGEGTVLVEGHEAVMAKFNELHGDAMSRLAQAQHIEKHEIGEVNRGKRQADLAMIKAELSHDKGSPKHLKAIEERDEVFSQAEATFEELKNERDALYRADAPFIMIVEDISGNTTQVGVGAVNRITQSNTLDLGGKVSAYVSRWWEYLSNDPREANMAGGIFPHIFGTVLMVIIMCILVVPFGVLAALYIREYAKAGLIVSAIRIAINNLAGVPSIVYGVFGLGFFIYVVGKYLDGGPENADFSILPSGQWFLLLIGFAVMVVAGGVAMYYNRKRFIEQHQPAKIPASIVCSLVILGALGTMLLIYFNWWLEVRSIGGVVGRLLVGGAVAVVIFLGAKPVFTDENDRRSLVERLIHFGGVMTCIVGALAGVGLIVTTPFFDGFAPAHVVSNSQFWGKGALVWASFTLALLTLPVVIVATEEALSSVPNSMREGSYACGASKWQTIKRIVLPRAMPGIMTGTILAMARGAGEVAPLMIVGVVAFTQEIPFSTQPSEAFGINRSFLHLGFHIYNMGFQSQDSEGAKPLVFVTTLLLILIVAMLNLSAIYLRSRLKRRFMSSAF